MDVTAYLAHLSKGIPFMLLSSGEVFDGRRGWYREDDDPHPINIYGTAKLEAERYVLQNPLHTAVRIVRTAGPSQQDDRSFVEDMCRVAKAGRTMTLFADEFRCLLSEGIVARAIWELVQGGHPEFSHLGGSERLSRWEIGQVLLRWYPELAGHLVKGTSKDHSGPPRPADLSLNSERIQRRLFLRIPGFRSWLTGQAQAEADLWDIELAIRSRMLYGS